VVTDRHEKVFLKHMGGILDHMDQDLFELVVIGSYSGIAGIRSTIRDQGATLLAVPNDFDQYVRTIRDAQLDLLYYWEVGTDSFNYYLPFLRLAPVQCTSWGVQVTSGIPQMDYYLSSELVEPEDARGHYTENLVLANTLLTYQKRVSLPSSPKPRDYFGISQEQHCYLCAQQLGKFHPDFDAILAGILRRDAKGVVVATGDTHGGFIANQLRRRFAETMPDVADRIVFIPLQPIPDYLSLVAAADVLLDPLHFAGLNTSYDGFSLNQPVVTLPARFERSRYTLGCYKKMGLSDCVASDPEQYVDIAVALGTDARFRSQVVERIRQASPVLFDDMEAVREHERIFSLLLRGARSARST
jgi:predicted O-linked N-acetylglucosamine transferase (SPINDLY family)